MPEWLEVGARLTVSGLSLVFGVLALLWGVIVLLVRLDRAPTATVTAPTDDARAGETVTPELVAAVMVALRTHLDAGRWHPSRPRAGGQSRWTTASRDQQTHHWPSGRPG